MSADQIILRPLCRDKTRYGSALEALRKLRERLAVIDHPLWAYRCQDPKCAGYHLSKVMPPERVRLHAPCWPRGTKTEEAA